MRINRMLRNFCFVLSFISFSFAILTGIMVGLEIKETQWWEFAVVIVLFMLFLNLGLRFHVAFKRKE